jgi:uncharacterized protein YqeY
MATALENELMEQMKVCMKSGDKVGLAAVRMVRTKVMEKRTAKNAVEITDEIVVDVIRNYVKVLQGSIDELKAGGASEEEENVAQMILEIKYLDRFLPKLMGEAEMAVIVDEILTREGITDPKMFGKATGLIMKDYKGKVDPGLVSKLIKAKLGG